MPDCVNLAKKALDNASLLMSSICKSEELGWLRIWVLGSGVARVRPLVHWVRSVWVNEGNFCSHFLACGCAHRL